MKITKYPNQMVLPFLIQQNISFEEIKLKKSLNSFLSLHILAGEI